MQGDAEDADAASTSNYEFPAANLTKGVTKGHMFTVLNFRRARDNVLCHILLVDSEGSGDEERKASPGTKFDYKLYALARMQSQILMIRPTHLNSAHENAILEDQSIVLQSKSTKRILPIDVLDDIENVEFILSLAVGKNSQCVQISTRKCFLIVQVT